MRVQLPFKPWRHQLEAHAALLVARFLVLVWHRRAGKTVYSIAELVMSALRCKLERGRFAYIAPLLKQARSVAWDYLRLYAHCVPGAVVSESELSVTFPNGAQVRLHGADNPDALRGIYLDGVVLDEVADMRPQVWGEIIRPALADRQGWAIFIGTPKGVNLFSELFFRAQSEAGWKADLRRAEDTGVIAPEELEQARREMTPAQYAQEFSCDFAAAADDVLLRLDDVLAAQKRVVPPGDVRGVARVLGVDCARYGDDASVAAPRQGNLGFAPNVWRGIDTMTLAGNVALIIERWRPDCVFVDVGGIGAGVVDRLQQLRVGTVVPVDFGSRPVDERFENKRAEMWWQMAEWVRQGGALPSHQRLTQDLTAPRYTFRNRRGRLQLESKDDMRERGLPSTDFGDAYALTFAAPVMPADMRAEMLGSRPAALDYDPFKGA